MPSETDNAEIEAFFDGWEIYRKVIEGNYMSHRELGDALIAHYATQPRGRRVLDLGCGDSAMASRVVRESNVATYHGVDLAEMALDYGRKNLADSGAAICLSKADLGDFVRRCDDSFDVITVGYSLHHYSQAEKRAFFSAIVDQQLLAPGGELLVYDVFREPGESREAYLDRYLEVCSDEWTDFDPSQWQMVVDHIRARDYPEEQDVFVQLGRDAGLSGGAELWRDHTGFHRLLKFG